MVRVIHRICSLIRQLPSLKLQGGFTIFHALITFAITGTGITGAWLAYGNLSMVMRIANADRQMDQYATSTMQEFGNLFSWSWGCEPVGGGVQGAVWRFVMKDMFGNFTKYHTSSDFIYIRYAQNGGLLINDSSPKWAQGQYIWRGRPSRDGDKLNAFDLRDGMTMTEMHFDYPAVSNDIWQIKYSMIRVTLKMQYRYSARYGISLFSNRYVHERYYQSTFFMRNWDVEKNTFKDELRAEAGITNG